MKELPASVGAVLAAVPRGTSLTCEFKEQAHVDIQEALAVKEALKLVALASQRPLRVFSCSDSCVVIGAWSEGDLFQLRSPQLFGMACFGQYLFSSYQCTYQAKRIG